MNIKDDRLNHASATQGRRQTVALSHTTVGISRGTTSLRPLGLSNNRFVSSQLESSWQNWVAKVESLASSILDILALEHYIQVLTSQEISCLIKRNHPMERE